jgi:hypothetical protein
MRRRQQSVVAHLFEFDARLLGGSGSLAASALLIAFIHPSAQKRNSANFACIGFSEVRNIS